MKHNFTKRNYPDTLIIESLKKATSIPRNLHLTTTDKKIEVSKGGKIRNRYNLVPHLAQVTNGKVTNLQ